MAISPISLNVLLLIIVMLGSCVRASPVSDTKGLYDAQQDDVNILYSSNATKFIVDGHQDGRRVHLVQFYSAWCGHCQAFAPYFKKFVHSIRGWRHWVDVSVINCADDASSEACKNYDIYGYPTVKLFWFKPDAQDKGTQLRGNDFQGFDSRFNVLFLL